MNTLINIAKRIVIEHWMEDYVDDNGNIVESCGISIVKFETITQSFGSVCNFLNYNGITPIYIK